jgi:hypothetical protein
MFFLKDLVEGVCYKNVIELELKTLMWKFYLY